MSTATIQPATYSECASMQRFSVARYQKMIETGILDDEDRVELLEEYVVLKMPRNPPHDSTIQRLLPIFFQHKLAGWSIRVQSAVTLSDSQPEPDFALVRGDASAYETHHPGPADVGLLVEVADSSLLRDQRDKTRIYARANIPIYWIVNLVDGRVEVYTQPSGPTAAPAYAACQHVASPDRVPLVLDGTTVASVAAADLLP